MKVTLETISPIHIGTGDRYNATEWYFDDGFAVRVYPNRIFLDRKKTDDYISLIDRDASIIEFEKLLQHCELRYRMKYRARKENLRLRNTEIKECLKTSEDTPYLPGSSIKGAMRTALFWKHLKDNNWKVSLYIDGKEVSLNLLEVMKDGYKRGNLEIREIFRDGEDKKKKSIGKRFELMTFYCGNINSPSIKKWSIKFDMKFDIMKFLSVSDFIATDYEIFVDEINTHTPTRTLPFKTLTETVEGKFEGDITINPLIVKALEDKSNYPLLRKKLSILGLDGEDIRNDRKMLEHIIGACREFYKYVSPHEDKLGASVEDGDIRMGFGVGTIYQGIILMLKNDAKDIARKIIYKFKLHRRGSWENYPVSYESTSEGKPLGWLSVSL